MMIDAFEPRGFTRLAVDSIFMMPQLGVLAEVQREAALSVFWRDCLVPLGWCIAPVGADRPGSPCLEVEMHRAGRLHSYPVKSGEMALLPLEAGETATLTAKPTRRFDVGDGRGTPVTREVTGGVVGIVIDARGRPLALPADSEAREAGLRSWWQALDIYPSV
jgi:hypothetical protein